MCAVIFRQNYNTILPITHYYQLLPSPLLEHYYQDIFIVIISISELACVKGSVNDDKIPDHYFFSGNIEHCAVQNILFLA